MSKYNNRWIPEKEMLGIIENYPDAFDEVARRVETRVRESLLSSGDLVEEVAKVIDRVRWVNPEHLSPYDAAKSLIPLIRAHLEKERPKIVCLCGSTRFKDEFMQVAKDLTCKGVIVLAPFHFRHQGDSITPELEELLSELHFRKIDMADEIFILNVSGYIGDHLRAEIAYAEKIGKPMRYLEALKGR